MIVWYKYYANILHPTIVPFFALVVFILFSPIGLGSIGIIGSGAISLVFWFLIPFVYYLYLRKTIGMHLDEPSKRKRLKLAPAIILSFFAATIFFWYYDVKIMFLLSLAYLIVGGVYGSITYFWKISLHTGGVAGPITAAIYVFGPYLWPLHILTVLMMYSRYKDRKHTKKQVLVGGLLAIILTYSLYYLMW